VLGVVSLVGLAPTRVSASPDALRGFGPRNGALAGANVADQDGPAAVLSNPSGLVRAAGTTLWIGYDRHASSLRADGADAGLSTIQTFEFGVAVPGSFAGVDVAFGLVLALPDGRLSRLRQAERTAPYFPLDDAGPRLVDLGVALAVRPLPSLELGGGIGYVASLSGGFTVAGTVVPRDADGSEYDSTLVHAVDAELGSSRYPLVGVAWEPLAMLRVAAAYRGAAKVRQRIRGVLDGELSFGGVGIPVEYAFTSDATVAYTPAEFTLGATLSPLARVDFHAALAWQRYSQYPSPYTRSTTRLRSGLPAGIGLPPDDDGTPPPPARFADRFVPRLGAEAAPLAFGSGITVLARLGYAYEHSPVPAFQRETLFFDVDRHVFGAGAGLVFRRPGAPFEELRFDLDLELGHGVPRRFETVGAGEAVRHRAAGDLFSVGGSLGLVFGDGSE
jgi:hypothetical protein